MHGNVAFRWFCWLHLEISHQMISDRMSELNKQTFSILSRHHVNKYLVAWVWAHLQWLPAETAQRSCRLGCEYPNQEISLTYCWSFTMHLCCVGYRTLILWNHSFIIPFLFTLPLNGSLFRVFVWQFLKWQRGRGPRSHPQPWGRASVNLLTPLFTCQLGPSNLQEVVRIELGGEGDIIKVIILINDFLCFLVQNPGRCLFTVQASVPNLSFWQDTRVCRTCCSTRTGTGPSNWIRCVIYTYLFEAVLTPTVECACFKPNNSDLYASFTPLDTLQVYILLLLVILRCCMLSTPLSTRSFSFLATGQAVAELSGRFEHVIAMDSSPEQLKQANKEQYTNVEWRVAPAESTGVPSGTVDLVTVAQALHWWVLMVQRSEVY